MEEKTVWKGSSSQVVNLNTYLICALLFVGIIVLFIAIWKWKPLLCVLVAPLLFALWKWIENKCRVIEVTTERIRISQGVFTKRTDELELYRVQDTTVVEPLVYRFFGLGNVVLTTADATTPGLTLDAINGAASLREELRKHIEVCRDRKRVRLAELDEPLQ